MSKAKRKLRIIPKEHFGFRVVNDNGDAELGSYHIADFSWLCDAEFFIKAQQLAGEVK